MEIQPEKEHNLILTFKNLDRYADMQMVHSYIHIHTYIISPFGTKKIND